jgi:hypothetical protein
MFTRAVSHVSEITVPVTKPTVLMCPYRGKLLASIATG